MDPQQNVPIEPTLTQPAPASPVVPQTPAPGVIPPAPPQPAALIVLQPGSPAPQVTQPTATVLPQSGGDSAPAGKSKGKLFAGIAGTVVVLLVIFVAAWFLYLSPAAQSKRLSAKFMHSITTGDVTDAVTLTGDDSSKTSLANAAPKVKGNYKLSQSKFSSDTGYYLYTLDGATDKYARTIIEKDNGKRVVHSFVNSMSALALVPSTNSTVDTTTVDTATTPETTATSSTCIAPSDYSVFSNVSSDLPTANSNNNYSDFFQLEFNPNATTYAPGDNPDPTTVFNDFKNFYAQSGSKKYTIELEASVNSASPDQTLANARNAKVQSDLETISGVPASRISIQPITNDTSGTAGDSFYRQVQITLRSSDDCVKY